MFLRHIANMTRLFAFHFDFLPPLSKSARAPRLFHGAVRGATELKARAGRESAPETYARVIGLETDPAVRAFLTQRLAAFESGLIPAARRSP